ncbi:hypothetical protein KDW36_26650 [Burkholderia dolosa]|uniref:hypothetical protein n=1 Tax=Burkholderia dolosa TaxID=152500 RepID=UPI001B8F69CE|nr:hypothetical protein [Burkholderia dolosa]MBR8316763.1 hypothetical protein [Burkholderia dolosa]
MITRRFSWTHMHAVERVAISVAAIVDVRSPAFCRRAMVGRSKHVVDVLRCGRAIGIEPVALPAAGCR